jgi:hypothetical protein
MLGAATATHHSNNPAVAFIVIGLFLVTCGLGFWASGKLRKRRNAVPTYVGLAAYWWVFMWTGVPSLVIGILVAAF